MAVRASPTHGDPDRTCPHPFVGSFLLWIRQINGRSHVTFPPMHTEAHEVLCAVFSLVPTVHTMFQSGKGSSD